MNTTENKNLLVALVGMPGAGKSEISGYLHKRGFSVLRFGQLVMDEVIARGMVSEGAEREVRNGLRAQYGMGALALLNLPAIKKLLNEGDTLIDDLYSWDEYKILKEMYGERFIVAALLASPTIRYPRLEIRVYDPKTDAKAMRRPLTPAEAKSRDYDQIEHAAQGGPIAMADFYFVNETKIEDLYQRADQFLAFLQTLRQQ